MDLLYPKRCAICDELLSGKELYLCGRCTALPKLVGDSYCMKCGKPVEEQEEFCDDCKKRERTFECGRSVFVYDFPMQNSIARFKYHGRQEYAEFYAQQMYAQYGDWMEKLQPDALIPVPVHRERRRKRGFNQAELIAGELSILGNIPVVDDLLLRIKNTVPQKELSDTERLKNLGQAFQVNRQQEKLYKSMKCVIIIDDIYTTGSTIEACSRILRKWGIERIYFLCICTGQGC